MTAHTSDLSAVGNIPGDYEHITKLITPGDDLVLPGAYLKWCDVHRPDDVIPDDVRAEAREFLRTETKTGRQDISGELGFVVFHLCGESFFFLIVCNGAIKTRCGRRCMPRTPASVAGSSWCRRARTWR